MPTIDYDRWHLVNRNNYEKDDQLVCRFEEWKLNV